MDILVDNTAGPAGIGFDWLLADGDLATDQGLKTAVIISLFSNRLAAADDELPDGSSDRQGWWGDMPIDGDTPDLSGSRLWLLKRAKATPETAARAQRYCLEALQWLLDDGVAQSLDVATSWVSREQLQISVAITRVGKNGATVNHRYDLLWNLLPQPVIPIPAPDEGTILADAAGNILTTPEGQDIGI